MAALRFNYLRAAVRKKKKKNPTYATFCCASERNFIFIFGE